MFATRKQFDSGLSLVEVIIAVGITGILSLGISSMVAFMNSELRAVKEKLAARDFEKHLISVLVDGSVCGYLMSSPTRQTFDSTQLGSSTQPALRFTRIPLRASPTAPPAAEVGQPASPLTTSLVIQKIEVTNIRPAGVADQFEGELMIVFDGAKMVRAVAPIVTKVLMTTSGPPTAKQVNSCQTVTPGFGTCGVGQVMVGLNSAGPICKTTRTKFFRFPTSGTYSGDEICQMNHMGPCVSQGNGSSSYLFCGTSQSDPTGVSAGVYCLDYE